MSRKAKSIVAEYKLLLKPDAVHKYENSDVDPIENVIKKLIVPIEGYIDNDGSNLYNKTENGDGILLAEVHMEALIKRLHSNIANFSETNNIFKDWAFPQGEEYFIRHVEIDRYMARNFTLIKEFPERFNFVIDKDENPIPINKWLTYNFGIENNGKIYLVKPYDTSDVLEKILPFVSIQKLPEYRQKRRLSEMDAAIDNLFWGG